MPGVVIIDSLIRGGSGISPFPVIKEADSKLSYTTVADLTARDALPEWQRLPYMRVHVIATATDYRLGSDTTIAGQVWTIVNDSITPGTYQILSEKNQPLGYVGLEANGKINPSYIQNIYSNNSFVVADQTARNNTSTQTGDIIVTTGDSKIWVKLNNNPPVNIPGDYAELLFPGSVLSVNGQTGAVSITISDLLAVPANLTDFENAVAAAPAVTALAGSVVINSNNIATNTADIAALQATVGLSLIPTYNPADTYQLNAAVKVLEISGRYNLYVANTSVPISTPPPSTEWDRIGDYYTTVEVSNLLLTKADLVGGIVPLSQTPPEALVMTYVVSNLAARNAITPQIQGMRVYVTGDSGKYVYSPATPGADPQGFVEEATAGITSFIGLSDVPASYTGAAGRIVAVNATEDGLEFIVGSFGHIIQNSGVPLTDRANLNFTNGLTASDNTPNTDVKLGGTVSNMTVSFSGTSAGFSYVATVPPTRSNGFIVTNGGNGTQLFSGAGAVDFATSTSGIQLGSGILKIKTVGSQGTTGQVLTSDGVNASWSTPVPGWTLNGISNFGANVNILSGMYQLYIGTVLTTTNNSYLTKYNTGSSDYIELGSVGNTANEYGKLTTQTTFGTGITLLTLSTNNSSAQTTSLVLSSVGTITISSAVPSFSGLVYSTDYSANFTNRSLVDKEYILSSIKTYTSKQTFQNSNGTIANINVGVNTTDPTTTLAAGDMYYNTATSKVKVYTGSVWRSLQDDSVSSYWSLSGTSNLTGATTIETDTNTLRIGKATGAAIKINNSSVDIDNLSDPQADYVTIQITTAAGLFRWIGNAGNAQQGLYIRSTSISLYAGATSTSLPGAGAVSMLDISKTFMNVEDSINSRGLTYIADYSANYTDRSLVDRGYVLGAKTYAARQTFAGGDDGSILVGSHTTDHTTATNGVIYYNSTANELRARINGVWVALGAGGGGGSISALTAATGTNTINNLGHAQEWQWNSLGGATGLKLSSTSTAAASNLQTLFEANLSGANATSTQTTYAGKFSNTHTGTSSTNVAGYFSASGGTNNYAGIFENGFVGIGTTTPGSFLEIKTNGTNYALNILNSTGTTSLAKFDKFGKLGLGGSIDPTYNLDIQAGGVAARLNSTSGTGSTSFYFSGASVVKGTITAYSSAHATKPNEFDINATNQLNLISGGLIYVSPTSGVLVGGTTITASAILDLQSTTKAFVPPRVTTAQKNAISSPSAGMFVYDTDFSAYSYHNGSSWRVLGVDGGLFYSNKVFSSTSWGGGNNSIYSSSELGTISNNTTFQVELIIELIQDSATVGSSGISARIVASFRKNNSGTVVQIGSTTVIFEHNDTGDSILTNTLSYSTNIMWDFTMSGTKTHTVKTYTKVTLIS